MRVRVFCPLAEFDFPHATADVFEAGLLLLTHPETEAFLVAFDAPDWISATVFGEDGYPLFSIDNEWLTQQVPHHPHPDTVKGAA